MTNEQEWPWQVDFTGKARKQKEKLPTAIAASLYALRKELEAEGPERTNWHHYRKDHRQAEHAPLPFEQGQTTICGGVEGHGHVCKTYGDSLCWHT